MKFITAVCVLLISASSFAANSFTPKEGFVPDEATAIAIAVAVWGPIYGAEKIQGERPFVATLSNGVWHVSGSLPKPHPNSIALGGVAEADIAKSDGRILRVIHGK